jgi:magnesium transporter
MVRAMREVTEKLDAVQRDSTPLKGAEIQFFRRVTTLFRNHADDWINDGEQALDTLGREVENVRCLASALSEKETFNINKAMNLLTAASVIFLPLTLITGIYGMNFMQYVDAETKTRISFTNMPELYWEYGYLFSFGLMALAVAGTSALLWRMGVIARKKKRRTAAGTRG